MQPKSALQTLPRRQLLAAAVGLALLSVAGTGTAASSNASDISTLSASASGEADDSAGRPDPAQSVDLEGVTVNGVAMDTPASPKYTAPPVDISHSLTVVPADVIEDTAASSLQEALLLVPGITFGAGEGGTPIADRPSIRGFNSTSNMFVDGMRDIGAQTREIFAIEQVEVVKGPDSAISGRSTGGGSINLVSKTARDDTFLNVGLRVGNADNVRATADANWAFAEHAALRLNVMGDHGGVPGRDVVETDKFGVAASLAFGLGTPTRASIDYYYLKDDGIPDYGVPNDPVTGVPITEITDVDPSTFYGLIDRDFRHARSDSATITVEHSFNNGMILRNRTRASNNSNSYVVTNPDDTAGNVPDGYVWRNAKSRWSENEGIANQTDLFGSFMTGSVRHSFDVGASFNIGKLHHDGWNVDSVGVNERDCLAFPELFESYDCTSLYNPDPNDPWQGSITRDNDPTHYKTITRGVYAFDSIEWSPHWETNLGLRWDSYNTKAKTPSDPDSNARSTDSFLSYQLGLVYKPVTNGSIYLSTGTSSTPAALGSGDSDEVYNDHEGRRGFVPGNSNLEPEETASVELGTKWQLADERLLVTAAVFRETRENANVEIEPGIYAQIGKTRVKGIELSASGQLAPGWSLFGGYSYLDGEELQGDYNSTGKNRPLINTPKNSLSLWTSYEINHDFSIGGGAFYRDEQLSYLANAERGTPDKSIPSWWRVDATAAYRFSPQLEMQLNVQNLLDETYYNKSYYHYAIPAAGRTFLLSLNLSL